MKTIEWNDVVDKSTWPEGPWRNEPDKEQWEDPETSLPCLIVRNRMGALCGYVGVDRDHALYGVDYSICSIGCREEFCSHSPASLFDVHGGLNYSDGCMEGSEERTICHVPEPGEPEPLWWFGFDTAHLGDLVPSQIEWERRNGIAELKNEQYRDRAYVQEQCASLARQIADLERLESIS